MVTYQELVAVSGAAAFADGNSRWSLTVEEIASGQR